MFLATTVLTEDTSIFALAMKIFLALIALYLVAVTNRALLYYFRAISAKNDDGHHRPTAIVLSLLAFIALIAAYAAIYLIEMPEELARDSGFDLPVDQHRIVASLYFSTITISTLGYGDITPQGEFARVTSAVEALNGLIAFGVFAGAVTGFMATRAMEAAAPSKDGLQEDREKAERDS